MSDVGAVPSAVDAGGGGAPPSGDSGGGFDFGTIDPTGDLDGVVVERAAPEPAAPAAPEPAAAVEPPAPQPAQPAQPAAPVVQPQQPTAPVEAPQQPQATQPAAPEVVNTPEGFLQSFEQGRDNLINIFAEQTFPLSDEEAVLLETNPREVVPKLLGKALFYATAAAQRLMITQLPMMFDQHIEATTARGGAERAFFEAFEDLKDPKYRADIQRFADFYKQYPDLPLADRIQAIGSAVRMHFKLPTPAAAPAAVAAPPNPRPTQVVQRQVFQPAAAAGGAARGGAIAEESDPFAGAMRDYDD